MAQRMNHEKRNSVERVQSAQREWTPGLTVVYPPILTGFECESCGLDQARFGSRFKFNKHRRRCATVVEVTA